MLDERIKADATLEGATPLAVPRQTGYEPGVLPPPEVLLATL